ncbi:MAG: hypothetical protein KDN18_02850 [Verrucomicrobiae bacterium]|nr:hypothetical protein [Verrucomicrobiae bacterium]
MTISSARAQEPAPPAGDGMVPSMPAPAPAATFVPGRMIGMRPGEKRPYALKADERNPYAKRSEQEEVSAEKNGNAEELRIREKLSRLRVTGRSQGGNGLRVLLGDIILEQGAILPPLLEDQSENLQVIELSDDTVVLGWLDIETNELTGKSMQVAYDLSPSIVYALHGQESDPSSPDGVAMRKMGVLRVGQDRKRHESSMASRQSSEEIPPEVFKAGQ